MMWDYSNQKVIRTVGLGWDTGAPTWPYQAPDTILRALHFPASVVPNLLLRFDMYTGDVVYYAVFSLAIVVLWWLIGRYFDGFDQPYNFRFRRTMLGVSTVVGIAVLILGASDLVWSIRWWWLYSRTLRSVDGDLILLRLSAPNAWCLAIAAVCFRATKRRILKTDSAKAALVR